MTETLELDLAQWNPMAEDFHDKLLNKYDDVYEGASFDGDAQDVNKKRVKYPYLVVRKDKHLITETLLRNFFGSRIIHEIEYKLNSRQYFVYFHNMFSLEMAWSKLRHSPNIISCVQGRPNQSQPLLPSWQDEAIECKAEEQEETTPAATSEDTNSVDLESRMIQVSAKQNKHPDFPRTPIVRMSDYTAENSMLALNDESFRYLCVKFEFNLERHGAYTLGEAVEKNEVVCHYRSGRMIVTPKKQLDLEESVGNPKFTQLVKKCLACKCYTDNSCRFCKMPFCNAICFDALSSMHKESCDTGMPPLIDDSIVPKFPKAKFPASGGNVKITAFEQSNVLYIRSADIVDEVAYYQVLSDVVLHGKSNDKLTKVPQCGQFVIYKWDSQIVRAMVLNSDSPESIYVVCIDFGSVEITTLEYLYECSDYLAGLPRYAMPVVLCGVPKRYMCPNLREVLYELDHNYTFVIKYMEREYDTEKCMHRVILIESELNRSLNRLIKTILEPIEPSISEKGIQEDYLQHVPLPTGKNVELLIMDNTFIKFGVIHCTILDFAYEINEMQHNIQLYGQSTSCAFYAPPKNDLCIAQYQGKWSRGLCMELVGDGYPSILFIDYGNIVPIHVNYIRPYPPQFTYPILTTEYELIGLPADPSEELLARLEQHLAIGAIVNFDEVIYNQEDNNYALCIESMLK